MSKYMVMLTNGREAAVTYVDLDNYDLDEEEITNGRVNLDKMPETMSVEEQTMCDFVTTILDEMRERETLPPSFQVKDAVEANVEALKDEEVEILTQRGDARWESD